MSLLHVLLKPAVRYALRRGSKAQELILALKYVLVEVGTEELHRLGEKTNKSKLSVLTGLQRRDIEKISSEDSDTFLKMNLTSKLIGQWQTDKRFSSRGKAHPLDSEGAQSGFAELVRSVSQDLNSYTVLFELIRLGIVKKEGGNVELLHDAYQPATESDEAYLLWARDIELMNVAIERNVLEEDAVPNLHINTTYDNIIVDKVDEIRKWILKKGAAFHAEIRSYVSKYDKDLNPSLFDKDGGGKISVCSFSLHDEEKKEGQG